MLTQEDILVATSIVEKLDHVWNAMPESSLYRSAASSGQQQPPKKKAKISSQNVWQPIQTLGKQAPANIGAGTSMQHASGSNMCVKCPRPWCNYTKQAATTAHGDTQEVCKQIRCKGGELRDDGRNDENGNNRLERDMNERRDERLVDMVPL